MTFLFLFSILFFLFSILLLYLQLIKQDIEYRQQDIEIYATCVRVPVMFSHGIAMQVELSLPFKTSEIKNQFKNYENIVVCENVLPSSVLSCKNDKVYVGRIRKKKQTLLLYCVADNIRVGAATNAFLILKRMRLYLYMIMKLYWK